MIYCVVNINDFDETEKAILGDVVSLESGQAVVKLKESNKRLLRAYKKYNDSEIFPSTKKIPEKEETQFVAFAKKTLDGKSLFRRKHGLVKNQGQDYAEFIVPYDHCKITQIEIVGCSLGEIINLSVLDSGVITGAPRTKLNQFGFNVYMPDLYYSDESSYDADLYKNMIIRIDYQQQNPSDVFLNITLHEVRQ